MGLLSDPARNKNIVGLMVRCHKYLGLLAYVAGIVWLFQLRHPHNIGREYISENALIPGAAKVSFGIDDKAPSVKSLYSDMQTSVAEHALGYTDTPPVDYFRATMETYGIDTYTQTFNVSYATGCDTYAQVVTGVNTYAIFRPPRADGKEALLLNVPYGLLNGKRNDHALSLSMALMVFFQNQKYLSRDIILLVSDEGYHGMEAWLQQYHASPAHSAASTDTLITADAVVARAGLIVASVSLELYNDKLSSLDLRYEGLNGQLSNLDLIYAMNRVCRVLRVPLNVRDSTDTPLSSPVRKFVLPKALALSEGYPDVQYWVLQLTESVDAVWEMIRHQSSGMPSGAHGLFFRYNIVAAATLRGTTYTGKGQMFFVEAVGRVLESSFHSLSNILERFHQSFFFYLTVGNTSYLSIGLYLPPLGLMCAGLLLTAITLWLSSGDWLLPATHFEGQNWDMRDAQAKLSPLSRKKSGSEVQTSFTPQVSAGNSEPRGSESVSAANTVVKSTDSIDTEQCPTEEVMEPPKQPRYLPVEGIAFSIRQRPTASALWSVQKALVFSGASQLLPVWAIRWGIVAPDDEQALAVCLIPVIMLVSLGGLIVSPGSAQRPIASVKTSARKRAAVSDKTDEPLTSPAEPVGTWVLVKCFLSLYAAISIASIALINFSLALILAVVLVPACVLVQPLSRYYQSQLVTIYLMCVSPLALYLLVTSVYSWQAFDHIARIIQLYQLLSIWTVPVVGMVVLPVVVLLQNVIFAN